MSAPAPAPSPTRPLYAAAIACPCGARVGLVEVSAVNNATCADCGRQFSMSHPARRLSQGAQDNRPRTVRRRVTER